MFQRARPDVTSVFMTQRRRETPSASWEAAAAVTTRGTTSPVSVCTVSLLSHFVPVLDTEYLAQRVQNALTLNLRWLYNRMISIIVQIVDNDHGNNLMQFEKDSPFFYEYLYDKLGIPSHNPFCTLLMY